MTQDSAVVEQASQPFAGEIRFSEILILTPQPYDPAQVRHARKKSEHLLDEIRHGRSFEIVAKAESQGPTADRGGDMGYFRRGMLAPVLENQLFRMLPGDMSGIMRTKQGFAIFRVTERREQPVSMPTVEVLTPTDGVQLQPYLTGLSHKIRKAWFAVMPESARGPKLKHGAVVVQFSVLRSGAIAEIQIASSSGQDDLDRAAVRGVAGAAPFAPLPTEFKPESLALRFHFYYNPTAKEVGQMKNDSK